MSTAKYRALGAMGIIVVALTAKAGPAQAGPDAGDCPLHISSIKQLPAGTALATDNGDTAPLDHRELAHFTTFLPEPTQMWAVEEEIVIPASYETRNGKRVVSRPSRVETRKIPSMYHPPMIRIAMTGIPKGDDEMASQTNPEAVRLVDSFGHTQCRFANLQAYADWSYEAVKLGPD